MHQDGSAGTGTQGGQGNVYCQCESWLLQQNSHRDL